MCGLRILVLGAEGTRCGGETVMEEKNMEINGWNREALEGPPTTVGASQNQ